MPTNSRRKSDAARRANQMVRSRTVLVMVLLGVCTFLLLFWKLYDLQINRHEELQGRAVNQQTLSAVVTASRGTIYDCNDNVLAISSTVYDVIISPKAIVEKQADLDKKKAEAEKKNNPDNPPSKYDKNV